jgi:hypothetical protein
MAEIPVPAPGDEAVALRPLRDGDATAWLAAFAEDAELKRTAGFEEVWTEAAVGAHRPGRARAGVLREEWQARPPR